MDQALDSMADMVPGGMVPVSVIIPCYRCHSTIERAVTSVLNQVALPAEIVLVEDCSNDEGKTRSALDAILRRYQGHVRIISISLPENRGAGEARNAGWALATQQLVAFLDADDSWHPSKLAIQAGWMLANPEYRLSCHESQICDNERLLVLPHGAMRQQELSLLGLLIKNDIATRTVMLRRSIAERFPDAVRYAEDYQLWLRVILNGGLAMRLCLPLACSYKDDFGAGGLSQNLSAMHFGVLQCFKSLRKDRLISKPTFFLVTLLETLKYWRRKLITTLNRFRHGQ